MELGSNLAHEISSDTKNICQDAHFSYFSQETSSHVSSPISPVGDQGSVGV